MGSTVLVLRTSYFRIARSADSGVPETYARARDLTTLGIIIGKSPNHFEVTLGGLTGV
jgi:hypothetical protein